MLQWRDRGYVADSDSDEEDLDVDETEAKNTVENVSVTSPGKGQNNVNEPVDEVTSHSVLPQPCARVEAQSISTKSFGEGTQQKLVQVPKDDGLVPENEEHGLAHLHREDPKGVSKDIGNISTTGHSYGLSSDEEEDELQLPGPVTTSSHYTIRAQKPDAISVVTGTNSIFDVPSSPLSDAPSDFSMRGPVTTSTPARLMESTIDRPQQQQETVHDLPQLPAFPEAREVHRSVAGRIFRQRNPIQLHPYLLEQEQYKQSLKARGVKPVAIASSQSQQNQESQDQGDSQFPDAQDEEESQSQPIPSLSPVDLDAEDRPVIDQLRAQPGLNYDSDELPDLSNVVNGFAVLTERRGNKRRKVLKTYSRNVGQATYPSAPNAAAERAMENDTPPIVVDDVLYLPPSPPLIQTSGVLPTKRFRRKKFKVPRGVVPVQLPSPPETSSQTPKVARSNMPLFPELSESEDDEAPQLSQLYSRRATSSIAHDDEPLNLPAPDSSDGSASEADVLKKVSNRLKGVLPASWLRLDQHAQQPRRRRELTVESPTHTQQHRGVAQRLQHSRASTPRLSTPALTTVLEISDDSDPVSSKSTATAQPSLRNAFDDLHRTSSRVNTDTQDIEEEDFVDAMLPTAIRNRTTGAGRKRQIRLADAFDRVPRNTTSRTKTTASTSAQQKKGARRVPRFKAPRLSVLDSRSLPPRSNQPDFLKLATRQARSKPSTARHSPRHKIIQMQDKRNDDEVKQTLNDWRRGLLWPKDTASLSRGQRPSRWSSIQDHVHLQQRLPSPIRKNMSTLKELLQKPRIGASKAAPARMRQSRLDIDQASRTSDHVGGAQKHVTGRPIPKEHRPQGVATGMPGQLEEVHLRRAQIVYQSSFSNELRAMRREAQIEQTQQHAQPNIVLERFLGDQTVPVVPKLPDNPAQNAPPQALPISGRQRKQNPQRLHFDEADIDFISSASVVSAQALNTVTTHRASSCTIEGLGPFGTYYTPDFDIKPLPVGTCFASSTFIGSGEFEQALKVNKRDMNCPTYSRTSVTIDERLLYLGAWTEQTSTQISDLLTYCAETDCSKDAEESGQPRTTVCIRRLNHYVSTTLYFLDSIDRSSFLTSLASKIKRLVQDLESFTATSQTLPPNDPAMELLMYTTVLAGQGYLLTHCDIVPFIVKEDFVVLLRQLCDASARQLLKNGLVELWSLHQRASASSFVEAGLGIEERQAQTIVVYHQLLTRLAIPGLSFTDFINSGFAQRGLVTCSKISIFDRTWHDIFAIMPMLSLDESGILVRSSRATSELGSLDAVKDILKPIFELYHTHLCDLSRPINPYIRASLSRCFMLIRTWGWSRCEAALSVIFDFFARNGFALLKNEEGTDSPRFLRELDKEGMPTLEVGDRSFDIFLKALYIGLHNLRSILPDKKIRNIAWRFIPNHGRQHEKDSTLKPADLQALRNTHDLLSVLYAASPPGFRPNLELIRNLANFTNSHSEICKLNIRSWANLVRYQLSTDEDMTILNPFVAWFNDMLNKLIQQHRQARVEAQAQSELSSRNGVQLSKILVESTIATNQRQIGGILVMAIVVLRDVVDHTAKDSLAVEMFAQLALSEVLALFGSEDTRVNNVLITTLEAYQAAYRRIRHSEIEQARALTPQQSEDSQDFGEFPDLDDIQDITITTDIQHQAIDQRLIDPVQQLLSNCFGMESCVDDCLLTKVVTVWVEACDLLIFKQQRSWTYYLDPHSSGSWQQLRDTDLRRKYLPFYITTILDLAPNMVDTSGNSIISAWLVSLVERESTLKYQHRLTAALLNACAEHPLFSNLPVVKDSISGRYDITLAELSHRRLAILSAFFSNMRSCLVSSVISSASDTQHLRHDYQDLLRQLMTAMKKNYQEIQQGSNTRGSYVDFVQRVIEELQQYTSDICPVDRFFTDSAAFPLPASDPTYVVGRLKSYGLKADDLGEQKKLAMFFQAVCERAAIDNQQVYLSEQLAKSVTGCKEGGMVERSTLRALLFSGILPAYLEAGFASDCGWILFIPVLEALTHMLKDLFYCFSLSDEAGRRAVIDMVSDIGIALCTSFKLLVDEPRRLCQPSFLVSLSVAYSAIEALAAVVDYLHRYSYSATTAVNNIVNLQSFGRDIIDQLEHGAGNMEVDSSNSSFGAQPLAAYSSPFDLVRTFCRQELNNSIRNNWIKQDGEYFVVRGNSRRKIDLEVGNFEEESQETIASIEKCLGVIKNLPTFAQSGLWRRMEVRTKDPDLMV